MSSTPENKGSYPNHAHHGSVDSCSFCKKPFTPDYNPGRKHVHYIFRIKTRIGIFYGPTHGSCIERISSLRLPGIVKERKIA